MQAFKVFRTSTWIRCSGLCSQVLQTPMAGARDPRTTLENPRVTSDSGRGAEASAKLPAAQSTEDRPN